MGNVGSAEWYAFGRKAGAWRDFGGILALGASIGGGELHTTESHRTIVYCGQ